MISEQQPSQAIERLGTASFPSGDAFVYDFGLIQLWSGSQTPRMAPELGPADLVEKADTAVDWEVTGPDAAAVSARLNPARAKGRFVFDVPPGDRLVADRVEAISAETGLTATARPIGRVPHLERVTRLLDENPDGAEVPVHGPWGVAVRDLPTDRELPVNGVRMDASGPDVGKWWSVWVECAPGEPVTSTVAGQVLVAKSRLLFADPAVLGAWRTDVPTDGLADLLFWGPDAQTVAGEIGAARIAVADLGAAPQYGWTDLPFEKATERAGDLKARQGRPEANFAVDFRPHDHHFRMLSQVWTSPTGSGVVNLDATPVTGFFTGWGDGAFPVFLDRLADGTLARIRVELGHPETVARQRRIEELWFGDLSRLATVSARVTKDGLPVGRLRRGPADPARAQDSGWVVWSGEESPEYLDDAANFVPVPLRDLLQADPDLEELFRAPAPASFRRGPQGFSSGT